MQWLSSSGFYLCCLSSCCLPKKVQQSWGQTRMELYVQADVQADVHLCSRCRQRQERRSPRHAAAAHVPGATGSFGMTAHACATMSQWHIVWCGEGGGQSTCVAWWRCLSAAHLALAVLQASTGTCAHACEHVESGATCTEWVRAGALHLLAMELSWAGGAEMWGNYGRAAGRLAGWLAGRKL